MKYSTNNGASFIDYFYALKQQGDVVKIFRPDPVKDANGNTTGYVEKVYATYTYDAWGKLIGITNCAGESLLNRPNSTALANLNFLRYRGYYALRKQTLLSMRRVYFFAIFFLFLSKFRSVHT